MNQIDSRQDFFVQQNSKRKNSFWLQGRQQPRKASLMINAAKKFFLLEFYKRKRIFKKMKTKLGIE